jgi:hypothetical protein
MTWRELSDLLRNELQQVANSAASIPLMRLGSDPMDTLRKFDDLQIRTRSKANEAIENFSRNRMWPSVDRDTQLILFYRLEFAALYVRSLASAKTQDRQIVVPDSRVADLDLIEWALIDLWHEYALVCIHKSLSELHSEGGRK